MAVEVCAAEIIELAKKGGKEILPEEANDIVSILNEELAKYRGVVTEDVIMKLIAKSESISNQAKIKAALMKRNTLLNARAYGNLMSKLEADPKNPGRALSAIMVGSAKGVDGQDGRLFSVDSESHGIMLDHAGVLGAELHSKGLLKTWQSGELEEKIYIAMFDGPEKLPDGEAGTKEARQIAEAIKKVQKRLLDRKNRAGANIGVLENYVVRQNHDALLMRGKSGSPEDKQAWIDFIKEHLDKDKTYENKPVGMTEDEFLAQIYDNLVSGNHQKTDGVYGDDGTRDSLTEFRGMANLAKKLSGERILHFKDGAAAHAYANKYSRQTLAQAVLAGITHDAQSIALLETFGTNPKMMFEKVLSTVRGKAKEDLSVLERFSEKSLRDQFAELDGTTRAVGVGRVYFGMVSAEGISSRFRMIQNMAKLGFATISSISDIATKAAFINANTERGIFGSYARALSDTMGMFRGQDRRHVGYLLGVGFENILGDVHARFGSNDSAPGRISALHQMFFRLNGMTFWNDAQKTGIASMLAADLATYVPRGWNKVPPETKRLLQMYGINEREFNLFKGLDMKQADGRAYLIPALVDEIPDAKLDVIIRDTEQTLNITDTMRARYRDKLRSKVATYYSDSADTAIPTPGARERAIMNQGLPRGTVAGEAIRMIMQLKGFPITYITKGMSRQIQTGGMLGLSKMIVGTTVMGYLALYVKDVLKGKTPPDPTSKDTLVRSIVQGGGMGIYGDFIFGQFNRYGQRPLEAFAGPSLGTASDLLVLFAKFRDGDEASADAVRLMVRNTPFVNLFYTKFAFDYLLIHDLQEMASPGYLRRMEKRIERDMNQSYFIPPSQTRGVLGELR